MGVCTKREVRSGEGRHGEMYVIIINAIEKAGVRDGGGQWSSVLCRIVREDFPEKETF